MPRGPILLVDDDADIREAMREALTDEDYEVSEAEDGGTALAFLQANPPPALILLDWNMAPMNAPQFMAEFIKVPAYATIPVILVTADMRVNDKVKLPGFVGYLMKPVTMDKLFAVIRTYCP